jgi:hypothetical protein
MTDVKLGSTIKQTSLTGDLMFDCLGEEYIFVCKQGNSYICKSLTNNLHFRINENEIKNCFKVVKEPIDESSDYSNTVDESGIRTIRNGLATIVILPSGTKGIAKCLPTDVYDEKKGFEIALTKALIKRLQKYLRELSK